MKNAQTIKNLFYFFALLIPWQIFIRVYGDIDLPLSFFVLCGSLIFTLTCSFRNSSSVNWKLSGAVLGYGLMLFSICLSSIIRSPDNLYEAANVIGHLSVGLIVMLWFRLGSLHFPIDYILRNKIIMALTFSSFPLALVGLFLYFKPNLEMQWVNMVTGILIEYDSTTERNNIIALYKTGVMFMNTNVGAIYWGLSMWTALWLRERFAGTLRIVFTIMASVFCVNVLAAGSRAALLALFFTLILSFFIRTTFTKSDTEKKAALNNIVIVCTTFLCMLLLELSGVTTGLLYLFGKTADQLDLGFEFVGGDRILLWSHAIGLIIESPLLGYGVIDFGKFGFIKGLPPHNILLQIWLYGGLMGFIGLVWAFTNAFSSSFKQMKCDRELWLPIVLLSWVVVQGMLTNLFLANFRIAMLLWLVVSLLLWSTPHDKSKELEVR